MMLTLATRIQIALAILALTVIGAVVLETQASQSGMAGVLFGWAGATFVQLLDMLQAKRRHSKPPPLPDRPLTREETGSHRLIRQPGLPLGPSDFDELDEDAIDTDRPPGGVLPLDDGPRSLWTSTPPTGPIPELSPADDDHDTDPQMPRAKRERQS